MFKNHKFSLDLVRQEDEHVPNEVHTNRKNGKHAFKISTFGRLMIAIFYIKGTSSLYTRSQRFITSKKKMRRSNESFK